MPSLIYSDIKDLKARKREMAVEGEGFGYFFRHGVKGFGLRFRKQARPH